MPLFHFTECGYYVARDYEHACELIHTEGGVEKEAIEDDFVREVPDDEEIEVFSEDRWDDPRERLAQGITCHYWALKLTAAEWVRVHPREFGYAFGGDQ